MRIIAFENKEHAPLVMDVDGDRLVGLPVAEPPISDADASLPGDSLNDATITVAGPPPGCRAVNATDCKEEFYTLTIHLVDEAPFWTQCVADSKAPECLAPSNTPYYVFSISTENGGCAELCRSDMSDRNDNLDGTAVLFRGDVYDHSSSRVRIRSKDGASDSELLKTGAVGNSEDQGEEDMFNIACYGSATSKLHFLRHTWAAMQPAEPRTTVSQRETMLQLLAADYCGDGTHFTQEGHPLGIDFHGGPFRPNDGVGIGSAGSVDAVWSNNGTGALCLGVPRSSDGDPGKASAVLDKVNAQCPGRFDKPCNEELLEAAKSNPVGPGWPEHGYAISTNAFPLSAP